MKKYIIVILSSLMIVSLAACGGDDDKAGKIVVSGKKFTEQIILTHIFAEYLKANTDLDVEVEDALGSVFVLHEAMKKDEIDMYIEYTGTSYENILDEKYDPGMTKDEIYDIVKDGYEDEYDFTILEPLGFNNTFILAYRSELDEKYGIDTYTELTEYSSELSFSADPEVFERDDGYDGLVDMYGYEFNDKISMDPDLYYQAAKDGEVDVIAAMATDARITEFGLRTLEDDKDFFPPYDAVPVIRQDVLDANEGLEEEINKLAGLIDDEKMREINGRVNLDGKQDKEVAIEFLKEEGLID